MARVRTIALLMPLAFTLSLGLFHDLPTKFIMMSVGQQRQNHLFNFDSLNYESLMLVSVDQGKNDSHKKHFLLRGEHEHLNLIATTGGEQ